MGHLLIGVPAPPIDATIPQNRYTSIRRRRPDKNRPLPGKNTVAPAAAH